MEGILVGDSLSMVVQGHSTTLAVTLDQMIYHAEMVGRAVGTRLGRRRSPFPSLPSGRLQGRRSRRRGSSKETRCQAVKLEGGAEQAETIAAMVSAGIPVMAHCGLRPQSVHVLGGYKVQRDEERLLADAKAAQQAGASPCCWNASRPSWPGGSRTSSRFPPSASAPAPGCDGQVLVT